MNEPKNNLQKIREDLETELANVKAVVGTAIGLSKNGREVVKVYTSVPTDQVELDAPLPKEAELEFIGEIDAQMGP
jgi:hypothetical protein